MLSGGLGFAPARPLSGMFNRPADPELVWLDVVKTVFCGASSLEVETFAGEGEGGAVAVSSGGTTVSDNFSESVEDDVSEKF